MNRAGLTLMEEAFCRLVAIGKPQTDAYAEAFGVVVAPGDTKAARRITKKASYLAQRPDVAARIVEGRIGKYYQENCLVDQAYVKENKLSVGQHVAEVAKSLGGEISIAKFIRFERGEGMAKREDNFAEEIAKLTK